MRYSTILLVTTLILPVFVSPARGQSDSDPRQMTQRFLRGVGKSSGSMEDKAIEGMIEMVTPEADENCRRVQRSAVKFLLDPNPSRSLEQLAGTLRSEIGNERPGGNGETSGSPHVSLAAPNDPPVRFPSGDPGWGKFAMTDSRLKVAKEDLLRKSEIYQENSQTIKSARELVRILQVDCGQIAMALLPPCQIAFDDLEAEYKEQLAEMKPNHPDMIAMSVASSNQRKLKEMLITAAKSGYAAQLADLLQGASIRLSGAIQTTTQEFDVRSDGIAVGGKICYFVEKAEWSDKDGLWLACYDQTREEQRIEAERKKSFLLWNYGHCHAVNPNWNANSPEVKKALNLVHRILNPMGYIENSAVPRDAAQAGSLLQMEVNKDTWDPRRIEELLRAGASPNVSCPRNGWTPLIFAVYHNYKGLFDLILRNGPKLDSVSQSGWTALMYAVERGRKDMVTDLIQAGADVNAFETKASWFNEDFYRSVLHIACNTNNTPVVEALLRGGAKVDARLKCGNPDSLLLGHWTDRSRQNLSHMPLHAAIGYLGDNRSNCGVEIIKLLIEAGADVNASAKMSGSSHSDCGTPIAFAVERGDAAIVSLLLEKGADPRAKTSEGFSPLCIASRNGFGEIVSLLIKAGADVNERGWLGRSALMHACWKASDSGYSSKYTDVVRRLIAAGADVNAIDTDVAASGKTIRVTALTLLGDKSKWNDEAQRLNDLLLSSGARE